MGGGVENPFTEVVSPTGFGGVRPAHSGPWFTGTPTSPAMLLAADEEAAEFAEAEAEAALDPEGPAEGGLEPAAAAATASGWLRRRTGLSPATRRSHRKANGLQLFGGTGRGSMLGRGSGSGGAGGLGPGARELLEEAEDRPKSAGAATGAAPAAVAAEEDDAEAAGDDEPAAPTATARLLGGLLPLDELAALGTAGVPDEPRLLLPMTGRVTLWRKAGLRRSKYNAPFVGSGEARRCGGLTSCIAIRLACSTNCRSRAPVGSCHPVDTMGANCSPVPAATTDCASGGNDACSTRFCITWATALSPAKPSMRPPW